MYKSLIILALLFITVVCVSLIQTDKEAENLRKLYSKPPAEWPIPTVDAGVQWKELGILPPSPLADPSDSVKNIIELGKVLFFDARISASGKISCATCHQPEKNWTDGKEKSVGHNEAVNKRNSPTIQNSWFYHKLFWDGRAKDLQDQAFAPIVSESEMGGDMPEVMMKLRRIKGYKELFKKAYGDEGIDPERMTEAISVFEKTIISNESRFDKFLHGDQKALTNSELKGFHLFRTKARCINCHNGPLFTDNQFHKNNITFSYNDDGLYKVTHKEDDRRKFKTPSLRDVAYTGPWMHNGQINDLAQIISRYSTAKYDPGEASPLLKPLGLTSREQKDLLAFLKAISAPAVPFNKPVLPE